MADIIAPIAATPAASAPVKMGEYILTSPRAIQFGDDPEHFVSLKLAAGYKAAFVVWDRFKLDIIQWVELRQHARLGLAEIFHLLQVDSEYTVEHIFEAFMADAAMFNAMQAQMEKAIYTVLGVAEQKVLEEVTPKKADGAKKKKVTPSNSTK